jgi:hypothetical protein
MILIGDGVMALVHPENDAKAWKKGPKVWRDLAVEAARADAGDWRGANCGWDLVGDQAGRRGLMGFMHP